MLLRTHIPSAPLSEFVEMFCYSEGHNLSPSRFRHLPTGAAELIINLQQNAGRAIVCGPFSESFVAARTEQAAFLNVQFKPGGAYPFFKLPADELHNLYVPLEDLWGIEAHELCERLLATQTIEAKFHLLEQFLLRQATLPLLRNPVVTFALHRFQQLEAPLPLAAIAAQIGFSQRHFIQLFRHQVGLTPKLFLRLQRFWLALQKAEMHGEIDWADLALDCGYFDQSHLIHEFRAFSGLTPSSWLMARDDSSPHILLAD